MGGGKRTRGGALPKIFGPLQKSFLSALSWIFVQEKQSADAWGGWKTYRTRGGPKPLFGRGVIREVFHPPPFSTPPVASSDFLSLLFWGGISCFCSPARKSLFLGSVFPFFSRDLGAVGIQILVYFCLMVFLAFFKQKKQKEGQGNCL